MTSHYNTVFKEVDQLVRSGKFDAAANKISLYRDDDTDPSLCAARFLLYSRERNNVHFNPEMARKALDSACDGGDIWSISKKGQLLLKGILYARNVEQADDLFSSISERSYFAKYYLAIINTSEYSEDVRTKESTQEAMGYLLEIIEAPRCEASVRELSKTKWIELILEKKSLTADEALKIQSLLNSLQTPEGDIPRRLRSAFYFKMLSQQIEETYDIKRHPSGLAEKAAFGFNYQRASDSLETIKSCL